MSKSTPPTFEDNMAQLEKVLARLEGGETSLDDAMTHFEEGMALVGVCRKALDVAEVKVQKIMAKATSSTEKGN